MYGYALTEIPELYLPYWPFEPFLSLAVIMLGVYLLRTGGRAASPSGLCRTRSAGGVVGA